MPMRTRLIASILSLQVAASAAPVLPQVSGSGYAFAFPGGGPRLEVEPATGARLSSLKLGTSEFLHLDRSQPNWGSTWWPAPQSAWSWPPPEALDRAAYAGGPQGSLLVLTSPKDAASGLAFTKRLSADDGDTSLTLAFTVRNGGTAARSVAPWQVTRVPPGGLSFFPKGPGGGRGSLVSQVKEIAGWNWFDCDAAVLPGGVAKYFADGTGGWMAHLDRNGLLLVETFPDLPAARAAPEEAEIEIYVDPDRKYQEVEHQGEYGAIAAGDSVAWTTRWLLRRLPEGIARKAGDPALVAYVEALLRRQAAALPGGYRNIQVSSPAPMPGAVRFLRPGDPAPVDAAGRRPGRKKTRTSGG